MHEHFDPFTFSRVVIVGELVGWFALAQVSRGMLALCKKTERETSVWADLSRRVLPGIDRLLFPKLLCSWKLQLRAFTVGMLKTKFSVSFDYDEMGQTYPLLTDYLHRNFQEPDKRKFLNKEHCFVWSAGSLREAMCARAKLDTYHNATAQQCNDFRISIDVPYFFIYNDEKDQIEEYFSNLGNVQLYNSFDLHAGRPQQLPSLGTSVADVQSTIYTQEPQRILQNDNFPVETTFFVRCRGQETYADDVCQCGWADRNDKDNNGATMIGQDDALCPPHLCKKYFLFARTRFALDKVNAKFANLLVKGVPLLVPDDDDDVDANM